MQAGVPALAPSRSSYARFALSPSGWPKRFEAPLISATRRRSSPASSRRSFGPREEPFDFCWAPHAEDLLVAEHQGRRLPQVGDGTGWTQDRFQESEFIKRVRASVGTRCQASQ
jgi:hypothetical protein